MAGLVAAALGGSECTVTLRAPPPLDSDLTLETDGATATLFQDDSVVVTASKAPLEIDIPTPPTLAEAQDAEPRFAGHSNHIFPAASSADRSAVPATACAFFLASFTMGTAAWPRRGRPMRR